MTKKKKQQMLFISRITNSCSSSDLYGFEKHLVSVNEITPENTAPKTAFQNTYHSLAAYEWNAP